jgi:DSF synthase
MTSYTLLSATSRTQPILYLELNMNAMADIHFISPNHRAHQVETRFDQEQGVYWAFMNPGPRPCFNLSLLSQLRAFIDSIVESGGNVIQNGVRHPVRYGVLASKTPRIFSLGGDLALFRRAIESKSRPELVRYGNLCVDNLLAWHLNCNLPMTTLALVQGDALGGGFEAALSASVLIAEENARMGFPEILFNLFPGMGAYSFLVRKVGRRVAEEVITSGNVYSARQLYDLGIVDVIAPEGAGEASVLSYVRKHARAANGRRALEAVRNEIQPITRSELERVVEIWADAALSLQERDLKMMDRLVRAQVRAVEFDVECEQSTTVVPLQASGNAD